MKYENIVKSVFISRPNRFIAKCEINGEEVSVHVKNTGRCRELLITGTEVFLEKSNSTARKTMYSLITVNKNGRLINIDSQAPNAAVAEALRSGRLNLGLGSLSLLKREVTYGSSRFDFYAETDKDKIFIEVKGVTLEKNNTAMFPDAPTERGLKHIKELEKAVLDGYKAFIIFVVQMKSPAFFTPNKETHKEFADELKRASSEGVAIIAVDCAIYEDEMKIEDNINVIL